MIQVERGADITEMEAPIPSTIGEGFTFCLDLDGEKYTTIGDYTKGKRNVEFCITSYIGYCGGAEHYYCSISISVVNRNPKVVNESVTKTFNFKERLVNVKLKDIDAWTTEHLSKNWVTERTKTLKQVS